MFEARSIMFQMSHHRSDEFNRLILPKCEPIIRAIGHRLAYEAAVEAKLDSHIINLFVATTVKESSAWFVEHGRSRKDQDQEEDEAILAALPCLSRWLDDLDLESYVKVPISTQESWNGFVEGLRPSGTGGIDTRIVAKL